jgi:hypothetical protein
MAGKQMQLAVGPGRVGQVSKELLRELRQRRRDAIGVLTLRRPKLRAALDRVALTQLRAAFESARDEFL